MVREGGGEGEGRRGRKRRGREGGREREGVRERRREGEERRYKKVR